MSYCKNCGAQLTNDEQPYCSNCGIPLKKITANQPFSCPNCNSQINKTSAFFTMTKWATTKCGNCGILLKPDPESLDKIKHNNWKTWAITLPLLIFASVLWGVAGFAVVSAIAAIWSMKMNTHVVTFMIGDESQRK